MAGKPRISRQIRRWLARHGYPQSVPTHERVGKWFTTIAVGLFITFVIASANAAGIINMTTAYLYLAAAWIISAAGCFAAEYVWNIPAHHKILVGSCCAVLMAALLGGLAYYEMTKRYELTHLVPDDVPTPPIKCPFLDNPMLVLFGDSGGAAAVNILPNTIIAIGQDTDGATYPILAIDRHEDKLEIYLLRLFDETGAPITTVHANEPWMNSNFHAYRPNPHEIIANDGNDKEVLHLYFLNKFAVKITGTFRRKGVTGAVNIANDGVTIGRTFIKVLCVNNADVDIVVK